MDIHARVQHELPGASEESAGLDVKAGETDGLRNTDLPQRQAGGY